jgi:hypothetical protein
MRREKPVQQKKEIYKGDKQSQMGQDEEMMSL